MDIGLIIWMIVAAVVGYQLFSALGREDGPEEGHGPGQPERPPAKRGSKPRLVHSNEAGPANDPSMPAWEATLKAAYTDFDTDHFLEGAKAAYETIVTDFAKGNLTDMAAFIDGNVLSAFERVIEARQKAGQASEVEFVGIDRAEIVSAARVGSTIQTTVEFDSNQIRVLKDNEGNVIDGTPNRIDLVKDRWTFARPVSSHDPNWTLVATGGASPGRKTV